MSDLLAKSKKIQKNAKHFLVTITGGAPITSKEEFDRFSAWLKPKNKSLENCLYREMGPPEQPREGGIPVVHQHGYFEFNVSNQFAKKPVYVASDGKQYYVHINENSDYSHSTDDYAKWIKYIRKESQDNKPYLMYKDPKYNEYDPSVSTTKDGKKFSYAAAVNEALKMTDYQEAIDMLLTGYASQYMKDQGNFANLWTARHNSRIEREMLEESYAKRTMNPWKEDSNEIQTIRRWVNWASRTTTRIPALFIVGPTKMGKTDFVNTEIRLKYKTFTVRGNVDFTSYNEKENYKMIIFDDAKFMESAQMSDLKALIASTGSTTNMNIKYGRRVVKNIPLLFVLNPSEYARVWKKIYRLQEEEWWRENTWTVRINKPLFYTNKELDELKQMSQSSTQPIEDNPPQTVEGEQKKDDELHKRDRSSSRHSSPVRHPEEKKHISFRDRFFAMYKELKGIEDSEDEDILSLKEKYDEREQARGERKERYDKWVIHNMHHAFDKDGNLIMDWEDLEPSLEEEEKEQDDYERQEFNGHRFINHEDSVLTEEYEENQKNIPTNKDDYVGDYENDNHVPFSNLPTGHRYGDDYDIIYN